LLELKAAAETVESAPFSFVRRHATSDGRFYGAFGDQACEFGIAGEDQHGDNEHITLEAFRNYLETMRIFLEKTVTAEVTPERIVASAS
jgi:acetylornithine deacetylase/succinyl-diaminopimelate desuccinylase-like protein